MFHSWRVIVSETQVQFWGIELSYCNSEENQGLLLKKRKNYPISLSLHPKTVVPSLAKRTKLWVTSLTLLKTVGTCLALDNWPLCINVHNREWRIIFN